MFGNKLNQQAQLRESLLAIVGVLMLFFAGFNTFYKPLRLKNMDLRDQLQKTEQKISSIQSLIQTLQKRNKEIEDSETSKASSDYRVQMLQRYQDPLFKNIGDFLNAMMQSDFRGDLNVSSLRHDPPIKHQGYSETKFSFSGTAKFSTVIDLIKKIEALPALLTLDSIQIQINPNAVSEVKIDIMGSFFLLENGNG